MTHSLRLCSALAFSAVVSMLTACAAPADTTTASSAKRDDKVCMTGSAICRSNSSPSRMNSDAAVVGGEELKATGRNMPTSAGATIRTGQ